MAPPSVVEGPPRAAGADVRRTPAQLTPRTGGSGQEQRSGIRRNAAGFLGGRVGPLDRTRGRAAGVLRVGGVPGTRPRSGPPPRPPRRPGRATTRMAASTGRQRATTVRLACMATAPGHRRRRRAARLLEPLAEANVGTLSASTPRGRASGSSRGDRRTAPEPSGQRCCDARAGHSNLRHRALRLLSAPVRADPLRRRLVRQRPHRPGHAGAPARGRRKAPHGARPSSPATPPGFTSARWSRSWRLPSWDFRQEHGDRREIPSMRC